MTKLIDYSPSIVSRAFVTKATQVKESNSDILCLSLK